MPLAARPLRGAPDRVVELDARHPGRRHLVEAHRDVAAEVAWIAAASSGVSRASAPSYTFRKVTPSSSTRAMVSLSENTWNPPESVRIGRLQP